jgi:hypothetical protein
VITVFLLLLPAFAQDGDSAPSEQTPADSPAQESAEEESPPAEPDPEPPEETADQDDAEAEPSPGEPANEEATPDEPALEVTIEGQAEPTPPPNEVQDPQSQGPATEEATEVEPEAPVEAPESAEITPLNEPLPIDPSEFAQASATAESIADGDYETLEGLSRRQVRWLKPKRSRLPANSRASTDYTAYVLEWGEVELGPTGLSVGALPRFQIGTVPALDALGLYNGWAKVNPLRIGGFDLALNGTAFYLPIKGFNAYMVSVGALASLQILEPWSVHIGGNYGMARAIGVPDLRALSPYLSRLTDEELVDYSLQVLVDDLYIDVTARFATIRVATDFRLNRRDSIVAQGQTMIWASVDSDVDLPPILNMDEALEFQTEGSLRVQDAYVASIAYQASWRRLTIRAGFGLSSLPGAWLVQSFKLNYRFGGTTRRSETDLRQDWRGNKADKSKRRERREAEDRGVWTPDQENPPTLDNEGESDSDE